MNSILIENNEQETEICLPEKSAQFQAMIYDEVRPISGKRRREDDEEERTSQDPTQHFSPKVYWNTNLSKSVAERRLALALFRKNPTPDN
ncbi:unnamed protein product [Parnassius apollo]|uniref:(apollo) hypothetical protein n=1 Tax=Parnassius apollo TaxID=110799 RepID=A0A8S3XCT9_PARAO|nr:unnamed protein product [Parnassius apollo]